MTMFYVHSTMFQLATHKFWEVCINGDVHGVLEQVPLRLPIVGAPAALADIFFFENGLEMVREMLYLQLAVKHLPLKSVI